MAKGILLKGIAGFYYVELEDGKLIECKARGKFRKDKLSPIVGDRVEVELIDESHGVITGISERKNQLIRPQVANVDQSIIVFALKNPDISFILLDKLLILSEHNDLTSIICLNKSDLDGDNTFEEVKNIYENIGYKVIKTNGKTGEGIDSLKNVIKNKVSVFAGPSGVGKSTLFNSLQDKVKMETGEISSKINRGKHTTRHAELIEVEKNTYLVDTPGFSSIDLSFMEPEYLQYSFREFKDYIGRCKFSSCLHIKEYGCSVKEAVEEGKIQQKRYDNYRDILLELMENRRMKKW
ncbi:ribosome small subunit-dependent GTPase A [Fonticella tunisiensis]|uniref:Small ribosomal subunit biogenesis GTPase RsgA n=1 Tax=Fonticella tunisiensis TaxID=1096341 RepID=A0A4R7KSG8_9CLOT|nr:ribosome small subunit-dependent GTPase A [Fonticella tunisiensis]TDT61634.1 ribosome biogenesis GTPase [Fonticella tunisiensis]